MPALIFKGEGNLHCSGGHNPEELSSRLPVTSVIYTMSQTSCGMENQNIVLFHRRSFISRINNSVPWSFRKNRAAMYSLGRVFMLLLVMDLLRQSKLAILRRPGVVLTPFIAHSLGAVFYSLMNSSEMVTTIFFTL